MKSSSGFGAKGIERVLELSADAQIKRREVAKNSSAFHNLTGAIAAYGKVLALFHGSSAARSVLYALPTTSPSDFSLP